MNRTTSNHFTYKFGPYDYYQGSEPGLKLPPLFINSVIFLETYGLEEEGLMHLRGVDNSIKKLRRLLCEGPLDLSSLSDVHSVTCILRDFFVDAPISLLPEENYGDYMSTDSRQFTLDGIREQLTGIPLSHQRVLQRLLIFFRAVLKQCNKNKVKLENLASEYGPIILRKPANLNMTPMDADMHADSMFKLMCKLLDNHVTLFEGIGLDYAGPEPVTWSRISLEMPSRRTTRTAKYTIPIELYNPSLKEVEENAERVRIRLNEVATRTSENYKRARERRRKVLEEAKEKAVREWLFTKRNFDKEKATYDRLHQIWQVACERVAETARELDEVRGEYESLRRYYGLVDEHPATLSSSSANSSPAPSPRLRQSNSNSNITSSSNTSTSSGPNSGPSPNPNSNSPTMAHRDRGQTDPVRPTLSSPPSRPVSTSFAYGSPIRPKIMRRSSDPPPKYRNALQNPSQLLSLPEQQQQQLQLHATSHLEVDEPEPLPQQQQRKQQVQQQLVQTVQSQSQTPTQNQSQSQNQNQTQVKPPPPPSNPTPSSANPLPSVPPVVVTTAPPTKEQKRSSIKFSSLFSSSSDSSQSSPQHSPQSSPQPSPVSPPVPLRHPKSLPPIPIPPPQAPEPEQPLTPPPNQPPSYPVIQQPPQQQSIQNIQAQERRGSLSLPRSHSDDQTKSKSLLPANYPSTSTSPPTSSPSSDSSSLPLSHSLPNLPSLVDVIQLARSLPQKSGQTGTTDKSVLNSGITEKLVLNSEKSVLNSSVADNYAALRPDELAHLEEVQAHVEYLEAELELNKFEMVAAEKEKKKAEMPYDIAQMEHWKSTQGLRRLDISDSDAEKWEIK